MSKRILGLWSGHDTSFCLLEDGYPIIHTELERHNREKSPAGDSVQLFLDHCNDFKDLIGFATCFKSDKVTSSPVWQHVLNKALSTSLTVCGHHQAHAAHAFYSSNFDEALVITIDGGGYENEGGFTASMSAWNGKGTRLEHLDYVPIHESNVGGVWTRVTRYVFRMESGWPQGNQAGTIMALAALGNPRRYIDDFRRMINVEHPLVTAAPQGHVGGMSAKDPRSPQHPYLKRYEDEARNDPHRGYDMAAALQQATEEHVFDRILSYLDHAPNVKNLCLAGGVALNSVMVGKIRSRLPQIENVYVPPAPYDGGLSIGAAQHLWHHVMCKPRVMWNDNFSPYLGKAYSREQVMEALRPRIEEGLVTIRDTNDDEVMALLSQGSVVSVFNGRAESGMRALGNRSIIADPRNPETKDRVNLKVKHRLGLRPFAPSIIREAVNRYFEQDIESPYMSHVIRFQEWARPLFPAVVHFDGTARLQTVTPRDNLWWYTFLTKWGKVSGHPILLNTSFNDATPIVETPFHAVQCFLHTDIDALYVPEHELLVMKVKA